MMSEGYSSHEEHMMYLLKHTPTPIADIFSVYINTARARAIKENDDKYFIVNMFLEVSLWIQLQKELQAVGHRVNHLRDGTFEFLDVRFIPFYGSAIAQNSLPDKSLATWVSGGVVYGL